jgi:hypothetical protein
MLVHTVLFWLRKDLSAAQREMFAAELKSLAKIQSAAAVYVGTPANTPRRPVVEATYDFALTVLLKDLPAHDAYQVDPIHKAFVAKCSGMWDRLTVIDAQ